MKGNPAIDAERLAHIERLRASKAEVALTAGKLFNQIKNSLDADEHRLRQLELKLREVGQAAAGDDEPRQWDALNLILPGAEDEITALRDRIARLHREMDQADADRVAASDDLKAANQLLANCRAFLEKSR